MEFLKNNKSIIIVAVLCLAGLFVYFQYFTGAAPAPLTSAAPAPGGANLLTALGNLQTVKLDNSLFSDPAFQSLADFGTTIPPQPIGRLNPFAPLQGTAAGGASLPQNITTGTATH